MANGQRTPRTAADVAQLESDNEFYQNENIRLERELAVVTADRARLQIENALLSTKIMDATKKVTRMETIVRVHSAGLVAALTEITSERVTERAVRRQVQEEQLTEETGPAPSFLRTPENSRVVVEPATRDERDQVAASERPPVQPETRRESDQDREDRLRGAAERLAQRRMPPGTPRIDTTLADRDSRMPGGPFTRADAGDLEELAGRINSGR